MTDIDHKRLALEMAEKIINTRLHQRRPEHLRHNARAGDVEYWEEIYKQCLSIISGKA